MKANPKQPSELQEAGLALGQSETSLVKRILDRITDGFVAVDRDWRVTYINRSSNRILKRFKRSGEDLIGKVLWDEFPDLIGSNVYQECRRSMAEQASVRFETFYPPARSRFEVHAYPSEDGLSILFHAIRKPANVEKGGSQEQHRILFESNPLPMFVFDAEILSFLTVNQAAVRQYRYSRQEFLAMTLRDISAPAGPPLLFQYDSSLPPGSNKSGEGSHRRKDGTLVDVEVTLQPIRWGGKRAWLMLAQDITEQKRAEQELRQAVEKLQMLVGERTAELANKDNELRVEVNQRKQAEEAARQLSARLVKTQEEERQRIARELHDSTGQLLVGLGMNLTVLKEAARPLNPRARDSLTQCLRLNHEALREIRTISYLLHPPTLELADLTSNIREYAEGFAKRSGIEIKLDVTPELGRLAPEAEVALFRVMQESLTNVYRHSGSRKAKVRIERGGAGITLEVSDNGRGIPSAILNRPGTGSSARGLGLQGMRERLVQLGGNLNITSGRHGTRVMAALPVPSV